MPKCTASAGTSSRSTLARLRRVPLAALAGAALLSTAGGAAAEGGFLDKLDGFYVSGGGTWMFEAQYEELSNGYGQDFDGSGGVPTVFAPITDHFELDTGLGGFASIGYAHLFDSGLFDSGLELRGEFEAGYFKVDITEIDTTGLYANTWTPRPFEGSMSNLNLMVNGIASFGVTDLIRPYIGAGMGRARTRVAYPAQVLEGSGRTDIPIPHPDGGTYGSLDRSFARTEHIRTTAAYQGMAGLGFAFTDNMELRLGYRYLGIGLKTVHFNAHSAEAGLMYRFGGAGEERTSRSTTAGFSLTKAYEESRLRQKLRGESGGGRPGEAGFELVVGGFFETQVGYAATETANAWASVLGGDLGAVTGGLASQFQPPSTQDVDGVDVKRDGEIHFKPAFTLENGIRVGGHVELEAATAGGDEDQIDDAFLFVDGSFGRFVIGSENSAGYLMHYGAPDVSLVGANDGDIGDWIVHVGGADMATNHEVTSGAGASERVSWFSPRIEGVQLGLSYARDGDNHSNAQANVNGGIEDQVSPTSSAELHPWVINNDPRASQFLSGRRPGKANVANIVDVGANWVGGIGGVDLAISGRYGVAFADQANWGDTSDHSPQVWSAGANLGWGGWTVGGSFGERNLNDDTDGQAWDAGVSYETGPWAFSFTWFFGQNAVDNIYNRDGDDRHGLDDAQAIFQRDGLAPYEDITNYLLGARYRLAKGVELHAFAGYSVFKEEAAIFPDTTGVDEGEDLTVGYIGLGTVGNPLWRRDTDGYVVGTGVRIEF